MNKDIYIKALNMEKEGDWDGAHKLIQVYYNMEACWIHAYFHRVEGDLWNAGYWYDKAGKKAPLTSLESEWEELFEYMNGLG